MAHRTRGSLPRKTTQDTSAGLMAMPLGVDLIRFEKNLLQMGFFGAHDTRHTHQSARRIEQVVNREGQKSKLLQNSGLQSN
jgi:hypothetical protein